MPNLVIEKLDPIEFDRLLKYQDPFGKGVAIFDLSGIQLISSSALSQLAAACFALYKKGYKPVIQINNLSVRSYLVRSEFVSIVKSVVSFQPPFSYQEENGEDYLHGANPLLIEVTKISSYHDVVNILNRLTDTLINHLFFKKKEAYNIATIASEILQNTFDHNDNSCGFVAMQVYDPLLKSKFLEIGVSDYGYGLKTTLMRNPKNGLINTDIEAIRKAIKLGVSEYDEPTRGNGLFHLCDIAYKHQGTVQIRSGTGTIRFRMDKKLGWAFNGAFLPGVQIALTLPINKE